MGRPEILVVGAGVSGLTTAIYLTEAGYTVELIADLPPESTTSAAAGASWGPYEVSDPRVMPLTDTTRTALERIASDHSAGVRLMYGLEVSEDEGDPPEWATKVPDFAPCSEAELAGLPSHYRSGWHYRIPVIDMPVYLRYLLRRLRQGGVSPVFGRLVRSWAELRGAAGVVVNCTGLGARDLVPDATLYPTRGQLVVVSNPGLDEFFQDNTHSEDLTYILPHGDTVVLGGCATDRSVSPAEAEITAQRIIKRCAEIEPKLLGARVIEPRVGLRPNRDRLRIEEVEIDGMRVIHNYGHGASGVSMSWGCAEAVCRLIG